MVESSIVSSISAVPSFLRCWNSAAAHTHTTQCCVRSTNARPAQRSTANCQLTKGRRRLGGGGLITLITVKPDPRLGHLLDLRELPDHITAVAIALPVLVVPGHVALRLHHATIEPLVDRIFPLCIRQLLPLTFFSRPDDRRRPLHLEETSGTRVLLPAEIGHLPLARLADDGLLHGHVAPPDVPKRVRVRVAGRDQDLRRVRAAGRRRELFGDRHVLLLPVGLHRLKGTRPRGD